ncbi:MAG: MFS transporter [Limisphaerales bacterium]
MPTNPIWRIQMSPMSPTASSTCSAPASPSLSSCFRRRFPENMAKRAVAICGFALAAIGSLAFYALSPANVWGMLVLTALIAIAYAPTIPLIWAIYADVADYSEWKTGRRFTGIVFATIGFALKCGLALGSASFLWIMAGFFNYDTKQTPTAQTLEGFRVCSSIAIGILFGICTLLLIVYQINKNMTIQMSNELDERRKKICNYLK